jgi:hypothetical protein
VDGKKRTHAFGEMLFTHFGVSGPIVLALSKTVVDALRSGEKVTISIDLKPALDDGELDARLLRDLAAHGRQRFGTLLRTPSRKLIPVCAQSVGVAQDKLAHQVTAPEKAAAGGSRIFGWTSPGTVRLKGDYAPAAWTRGVDRIGLGWSRTLPHGRSVGRGRRHRRLQLAGRVFHRLGRGWVGGNGRGSTERLTGECALRRKSPVDRNPGPPDNDRLNDPGRAGRLGAKRRPAARLKSTGLVTGRSKISLEPILNLSMISLSAHRYPL